MSPFLHRLVAPALVVLVMSLPSGCAPASSEKTAASKAGEEEPSGVPSAETTRIRRSGAPTASIPDDGFIHDGRLQPASAPSPASPLAGGSDLTGTPVRPTPPAPRAQPGEDPFKAIPSSVDNQSIRHEGIGLGTGAPPAPGAP